MVGAVDIGGTKIAVGIVEDSGRIVSRAESPTEPERGYSHALERIAQMLRETARSAGDQIAGIGIGSTGPVDPFTGEIGNVNFMPSWEGQNPVQDLARIFGISVAMENDADAAALAEAAWGAGRNKKRLIYVTIGTGIGGGVILDGDLYRGVDGAHPEIGHHVIDPSGPLCQCGFHGCWESLAAGPAMVSWLETRMPKDSPQRTALTAKRICKLAQEGDELALQAVQQEAYYLGLGMANLVTMFAPDAIVLGGGLMNNAALFLQEIRRTICESCHFVPYQKTELSPASLGPDANLVGAARVWHHRFTPQGALRV